MPATPAMPRSSGALHTGASLSSRVGTHKDYRIYRSTPLSEPLRGLPPMARPVDASYYTSSSRSVSRGIATPPSSTGSTSSSASSSGLYYRQRSESFEAMLLGPSSSSSSRKSYASTERRSQSTSALGPSSSRLSIPAEPETPFDAHLQAVYDGTCDPSDGLAFFESHGYYDVDDANTVEMFRQNFGLTDVFWDKTLALDDDPSVLLVVDDNNSDDLMDTAPPLRVSSVGTTLYRRHRTVSGRFELVDDDPEAAERYALEQQQQRDARLRAKVLELDEFDLNELAHEQAVLVDAIDAIRAETQQFHAFFSQAFRDEDAQHFQFATPAPVLQHVRRTTLSAPASAPVTVPAPPTTTALAAVPASLPMMNVELPPYCSNVFVLKDTIPYLLRSWHKRWCYLDFRSGLVLMYKRSYWRSPRGVLDLRDVTKVERMNANDFRLEFRSAGQPMMLLRTKLSEEAALWVNLLRFAKHQLGPSPPPALPIEQQPVVPSGHRSTRFFTSKSLRKSKQQQQQVSTTASSASGTAPKNQVEMLAMLLSQSATPASSLHSTTSSTSTASALTSSSSTQSPDSRRNSVTTA